MYLLCIYKKPIILSLFKIYRLKFIMYILTILKFSLRTCVIRLRNLTSINIIFSSPQKIIVFLYNCKEKDQKNRLKKPFKNSASLIQSQITPNL